MDGSAFRGLEAIFKLGGCLLAIFMPLGLWKLVELVWWVWSHLHWGAP